MNARVRSNLIYDGVIQPEVTFDDGSIWKNLTTLEKSKVAETLDEFRGNYRYNLMDENLRRFNAEVPIIPQWDDPDRSTRAPSAPIR